MNNSMSEESITNSVVTSSSGNTYRNLSELLKAFRYDKSKCDAAGPTHTRIGDDKSGIHGGAYYIPDDK